MRQIFLLGTMFSFWCALGIVAEAGGTPQAKPVTCEALRATKAKVYGFHPAQLNEAQIDAKGKDMDAFWKEVRSSGPEGVSCLRTMLAEEKSDRIFQFDAGETLFLLDQSPQALIFVRDAIGQADFQETDPANYLSLALDLSLGGVDIQPLAARLLRYPDAVIHISEHALDLDSDTAALFLYGSMPGAQASNALITDLQAPESFVRSAAAHLLAEQMTGESFRALSQWKDLSRVQEDFRRNDIQAVMKYQASNEPALAHPKFSREQVLNIISTLPHTRKEFDDVMSTRGAAFDKQIRDKKATQQEIANAVEESEPIYGIADHTAFLDSAVATLQPADLDTLREARRKSLYNVSDESLSEYLAFTQLMIRLINRLDLYKEYRAH